MKVDPDGLLASLIKSPILVNPYSAIENQLIKKAAYVQSRVEKLQQYNDLALAGTQLTPIQDDARTKLDEVVKHQNYVKHLTSIVQRDRQLFEKSVKAADILLTQKLDSFRSTTISQTNVHGEIINRLLHPPTLAAFLTGTKGAIKVTKEEVNALSRLKSAFFPSFDDCASVEELEERAAGAAMIVSHIFSEAPHVVDEETGLNGKEVFALLNSIKNCGFFSGKCMSLVNGADGSVAEASDTNSPSATSTDSVDDDTNEETSFPLVSESTNTEKSNGADYANLDDLKNLDNSVATEEVGKQTILSSSWKSEEKVDDANFCSANESDSFNGTATQFSDMQSIAVKEMKEKSDYGQKKRAKANYNGERLEYGRYTSRHFSQPWDRRYHDRTYNGKGYRYTPENGEQQAAKKLGSMSVNPESGDGQWKQRDRRFPKNRGGLSYKDGRSVSYEGPPLQHHKETDNSAHCSRQNMVRYEIKPSVPLNREPVINRRPPPATVGFIFADRR
ncbi:unnamed protein product [Angiostrongylus costaricensis]|uniref:Caprin-1_dimer domain-containing protein n=1 Tax=Angiostrongylus costaricensis TaxID=334426 RepID=A0A0R3PK11_ANGCS|nr:unnamed protein product [Angiostrongylus costaricensis]